MYEQHNYNEKELLLQVATGDEQAFTTLFLQWQGLLGAYIYRITESRELTEEIVQDVFLKIWMIRDTLTGIHNFRHFLLVVSRNRAFDVMKKNLREEKLHKAWVRSGADSEAGPAENDLRHEYINLIDEAIDKLPPRRKEVYLLSRHQRLSYQEIADQLHISRATVKTQLKLAADSITAFIRPYLVEIALLSAVHTFF